jgi:hypothetical protein
LPDDTYLYLPTKNVNFGIFWTALGWVFFAYFMTILYFVAIFVAILVFLWSFGKLFYVLVCCDLKNLATLNVRQKQEKNVMTEACSYFPFLG